MKTRSRLIRILCVLLAAVGFLPVSQAAPPESGVYWSQAESGRGYQIEIQGSKLGIYAYAYEADGSPVFYLSAGQMSSSTYFTGTLFKYYGGQCYGCAYKAPTGVAAGTVTINFTSPITAQMNFLGQNIALTRFDATNYLSYVPGVMLGEWSIVTGSTSFPVYFGDRLVFNDYFVSSSGQPVMSGYIAGSVSNTAVAMWDSNLQEIDVLVDSSTSYYKWYRFKYSGFNRLEGRAYTFLKTESPSSSLPAFGLRMNFLGESKFGAASVTTPETESTAHMLMTEDQMRIQSQVEVVEGSTPLTAAEVAQVRAMEAVLVSQQARRQGLLMK